MVRISVTESQVQAYIEAGGKITTLPPIDKPRDRTRLNSHRAKRSKAQPKVEPLSPAICQQCQEDHGHSDKRCLACPHYRQWIADHELTETIAFEHVPQAILENVAAMPAGMDLIDKIRKLPLHRSVPLIMQYVLNASNQEIGDYHKITRQSAARKNKLTIKILRTSMTK